MGNRTMAHRYARALAEVLPDDADLARVQGEFETFAELLRGDAEINAAFTTQALGRVHKKQLLESLARQAGFHAGLRRLLTLLAESRRLNLWQDVQTSFNDICDERRRIVAAEVTTAVPLVAGQEEKYLKSLERMTGKQVRLQTRVDAGILGGAVTRIGSEVYDGSVRGRLERLQERLKGE
jgi:F-type H+-transporting ATPase subunit delta